MKNQTIIQEPLKNNRKKGISLQKQKCESSLKSKNPMKIINKLGFHKSVTIQQATVRETISSLKNRKELDSTYLNHDSIKRLQNYSKNIQLKTDFFELKSELKNAKKVIQKYQVQLNNAFKTIAKLREKLYDDAEKN